jgi:NTF2 fold immunity protein
MRALFATLLSALVVSVVLPQSNPPKNGYVPDSKTAGKIAEAVLVPVYGEDVIRKERPFVAKLSGNVWTVEGTMYCEGRDGKLTPGICSGGVAVVKLSKNDGRILFLAHYK